MNWKRIKQRKTILILALIILVGIYFRTSHFHDWARFNSDQARDAAIIDAAVEAKKVPIVGPLAGGTEFRLGPAFYEFQYLAARIFGNQPDVMAYPTLFFSILAIPLLFFLSRKIFSKNISFALAGLFSLSFFAIKYSRFAWNPNDAPFFVFALLLLLPMAFGFSGRYEKLSAAGAGLAAGIAVQLHTTLLVLVPVIIIFTAVRALIEKKRIFSVLLIIGTLFIISNLPQIYHEIRTRGVNVKEFASGVETKTGDNLNFGEKVVLVSECFVKSNYYILSASGANDRCGFFEKGKKTNAVVFLIRLIGSLAFLIGGAFLAFRAWKKEESAEKKIFLEIFLAMGAATFLLFLPVAREVSMRFFLVILFLPFVLAGFWLEQLLLAKNKVGILLAGASIAALLGVNIRTYWQTFPAASGDSNVRSELFGGIRLGDAEGSADYIIKNAPELAEQKNTVYINRFEYTYSLRYLIAKKSNLMPEVLEKWPPGKNVPFFFIKKNGSMEEILNKKFENFSVKDHKTFERYTVFKAVPKTN